MIRTNPTLVEPRRAGSPRQESSVHIIEVPDPGCRTCQTVAQVATWLAVS
jgi:hypothetical protein